MAQKKIPLDKESCQAIEKQIAAFRKKFGREPGPNDPIFFDPDADTLDFLFPSVRLKGSRIFSTVDHAIFTSLWQWARRKHPTKSARWIQQKYWGHHQGWNWTFFGVWQTVKGKPTIVWLQHARRIPIRRHVKVKSEANAYDPLWKEYFAERRTFRSDREDYLTDPAIPVPPQISNHHRVSS